MPQELRENFWSKEDECYKEVSKSFSGKIQAYNNVYSD